MSEQRIRRCGYRWEWVYNGPPNRHPILDFIRHMIGFFKKFVDIAWLPMLFALLLAAGLAATVDVELMDPLAAFVRIYTIFAIVILPLTSFIAFGIEVGFHFEFCAVPPEVCNLKLKRCYVRRCEHNKWWRCKKVD